MTSPYSSMAGSTNTRAAFTQHQTGEVANSLTQSKQVANDLAENHRYQYRAKATVLGSVDLEPFDAVYLDQLPGGMSGYWTVLSVRHIFGDGITYKCELEVGTDLLGQGTPPAGSYRDFDAELNNPVTQSTPVYVSTTFIPGLGNEFTPYGTTPPTAATTSVTATAPDFSIIRQQTAWRAG
jgi:hypothetical protein